jgi:hypothetical protein
MPKQQSPKRVSEESLYISATAPVKELQKPNPDDEANTVPTHFHAVTGANKLRAIPVSLFDHSSHAGAALFPEPSSTSRNTVSSVTGSKKHKQLPSVKSQSQIFSPSRSKIKHMAECHKMGEINVGVYHRIKKHKNKLIYKHPVDTAQCKIMPEDRIQCNLNKTAQSITDTKNSVHNKKVHFTPSHGVQPRLTGSRMKVSISPLTPSTVELTCPATPPPDPRRQFFKLPPIQKSKTSATVTVNKNNKLVSFCSFKDTGQLNIRSKYENCPLVICNMDCKVSSFFPSIITRLHEC